MITNAAKHTAALGGTAFAVIANALTDTLPHLATAAAAFSGFAAGIYYAHKIYLNIRDK